MCGISALFTSKEKELASNIKLMTDLIRHRGPDDEGYVTFNRKGEINTGPAIAAVGHRRLSIIDLSHSGHQPMCTQDSRYWISYNGEIYNYLEIKQELLSLGYRFTSQTDTEVILASFQEWGISCLSRFNGMFAFVIYDTWKHIFFAVRDRFGVKPLYYWQNPQGFLAIGSEIKQFTVLPGWNPMVNHQMAYDFLNWGVTDHTTQTLFSDVYQLRGGHYIIGTLTSEEPITFSINQWYSIPQDAFKGSYSDAVVTFTDILKNSISLRLRADVSVGSCLSGGLDSTSIVCHMNAILNEMNLRQNQKTFSAYSENKNLDESTFISSVVDQCKIDAYHTTPSLDELEKILPDIVWHQDEPFGSSSIFAQWQVFDLAKKNNVKVILDGQGADEILAGYHPFHAARFYDLFTSLKWISLSQEMVQTKKLHSHLNPLILLGHKILPEKLGNTIKSYLGKPSATPTWLNVNQLNINDASPFKHRSKLGVKDLSHRYLYEMSLPMLLRYEDRDSMAHSIEARTPFLDYRLVEFAYQLPGNYKISNGITKKILRDSTKGVIPEMIRKRMDKIAFATAEELWFKQRSDLFRKWISNSIEMSGGVINHQALAHFDKILDGQIPYDFLPWRVISFGLWMERFSSKFAPISRYR